MSQATRPTRRWYHWLTQFSLRTLLIVVTLAAVVCWWFLRPPTEEEELAGPRLTLRRQVRLERRKLSEKAEPYVDIVSHGTWRMSGELEGVIARGTCQDGQPHGHWTLYHPSGSKAAEGRLLRGLRTGLWKVWDADGRPVSEVNYAIASAPLPHRPPVPRPSVTGSLIPVVGMIDPLEATAPLTGLDGGFGYVGVPLVPVESPAAIQSLARPCSIRHGPCRGWHSSGELRFTGKFENDLRTGPWAFYDEQGRKLESGDYVADRREGAWTIADPAGAANKTVEYVAGRPRDEYDRWLAMTRDDLASGDVRREVAAAERLVQLGPHGEALLVELLGRPSRRLQLMALRSLARQSRVSPDALPKSAALIDQPDERLALRAMLVVFLHQADRREGLWPRLQRAIEKTGDSVAFESLLALFPADGQHRDAVVAQLIERMGTGQAQPKGWVLPPDYAVMIGDLGWDVLPPLERTYASASPDARLLAIHVLHNLVARGEQEFVEVVSGVVELRYEIPAEAQPLLDRAKADADPRVREAAEHVGKSYFYGNFSGFGGQGFGRGGGFF
jgi:hypothetical protein